MELLLFVFFFLSFLLNSIIIKKNKLITNSSPLIGGVALHRLGYCMWDSASANDLIPWLVYIRDRSIYQSQGLPFSSLA